MEDIRLLPVDARELANNVTSQPRATSPSVMLLATVSQAPYCRGGVRQAIGDRTATLLSGDISEYAYKRGAASLLDFLDAERSYRSTQLAYRQALASYMTALE